MGKTKKLMHEKIINLISRGMAIGLALCIVYNATLHIAYAATLPEPYLMMVGFYSTQINASNLANVKTNIAPVFNQSAYHGIAVAPVRYQEQLGNRTFDWMANTGITKQIWPWVFFNRFIGFPSGQKPPTGQEFFGAIKGMDVLNKAGALQEFYDILTKSLEIAKKMGSPGIVLDPEPYNDGNAYGVSYEMQQTGLTEAELISALKNIGRKITDIVDTVYPDAVIWSFFAPLYEKWPRTTSYVVIGLLERAKEKNSRLKFIAGGEVTLYYCQKNLAGLNSKIESRKTKFESILANYPNLKLGGTISPWHNVALKTGWMTQGECGSSDLKTITDFGPLFKRLFEVYDYVWIYAAGAAGYDPFNRSVAPLYDAVLRDALTQAQGALKEPPTNEPPTTQPPATQPPTTQPPTVQPPAVNPPTVQPPNTKPPATQTPTSQSPNLASPLSQVSQRIFRLISIAKSMQTALQQSQESLSAAAERWVERVKKLIDLVISEAESYLRKWSKLINRG